MGRPPRSSRTIWAQSLEFSYLHKVCDTESGKVGRDQSGRNDYKTEYNRANYDYISATVPRGKRAVLRAYADKHGKSISQVIVDAVEIVTGLDLSSKD